MLTATEVQTILDACDHLRDRLLFALLLDCGVRIGEALGLRHEDMGIAERTVTVMPRPNDNGARAKAGISRTIPASAELMRLYADYLTREYGSLDSDYVFVNLWSQPYGRPWAYAAVYDLVLRLRERTGIDFEPHQYRHTYATWLLRRGAGMDGGEGVPRARFDHHNDRYLRSPDRRGRPENAGGRGLVHRPGGPAVIAVEQVPGRSGLLEQLTAIVRPEFRTDIYIPAPDNTVFVADECAVEDCDRTAVSIRRGLCNAHAIRFRKRGRPP